MYVRMMSSGKPPNFFSSEWIEPPGTYSRKMFNIYSEQQGAHA